MQMRQCGDCQLCCKLMPMQADADLRLRAEGTIDSAIEVGLLTRQEAARTISDFDKPSGERCKYQRAGKGCIVYDRRPFGCRFWNCRWLTDDDVAGLSRPDRSHYVIDISPDYVETDDPNRPVVPVIQIWIDPDYPDAHKDPALRAFLLRRAEQEGYCALIRSSASDAFLLVPPIFDEHGEWVEKRSAVTGPTHTTEDKVKKLGNYEITIVRR